MNSLILNSINKNIPGLKYNIYSGYFADNVNWFNTATIYPGTKTLYATDFTTWLTATNNQISSTDYFSVQWYGKIVTPAGSSGLWTFYTTSDDASYLWIGSTADSGYTTVNAVVNNGSPHAPLEKSGTISLTEKTVYSIRIQFGEAGGGEAMSVSFTKPGGTKQILTSNAIVIYS